MIYYILRLLVIDAYTVPAYFMFTLTICTILILNYIFTDRKSGPAAKKKRGNLDEDDVASTSFYGLCTLYEFALCGCLILNSTTRGAMGVFETMNVIIADEFFGLPYQKVGSTVGKVEFMLHLVSGLLNLIHSFFSFQDSVVLEELFAY